MLLTAACGLGGGDDVRAGYENSEETAGTGRYIEMDITPPINGRFISLVTPDGNLAAFDTGLERRYDSTDGGMTWVQSAWPGYGTRFAGVETAAFLPDGRLLVFVEGEGMTTLSPDGTRGHFPIYEIDNAIQDGENVSVSLIQVLDDGQVLLTYTIGGGMMDFIIPSEFVSDTDDDADGFNSDDENDAYEADNSDEASGEGNAGTHEPDSNRGGSVVRQQVTVTANHGGRVTVGDDGNIIWGGFGQVTAIYDIATGRQVYELAVPVPLGANSGGDVYTMQGHSLMRHGADGYVDTVLDGTAFAFGVRTNHAAYVQSLAEGGFIVNVLVNTPEGQVNRLFRYAWDANAAVDPAKTITIWSLEDNALVRAAITEIWRQNPDACITYEIAPSGDGAMSASDAVRTLNTRLLSGRGPDILILDGTPIGSYVDRGMLVDLTGRVNTAEIYQNLLAPYIENGRMYVVPTQFSIPVLIGCAERIHATQSLAALVERVVNGNLPGATGLEGRMLGGIPYEERAELYFRDLNELFEIMWQANAAAFIYDNRLDSDALGEFLRAVAAISDMYGLGESDDMSGVIGGAVIFGTSGGGGTSVLPGSPMQFMMQATNMAAFSVNNLSLLQMTERREEPSEFAVFPGLSLGAWQPSTIAGVSADTDVEDFAIQFVNMLLSVEVQMMNHGEGLPITREGLHGQINLINELMAEHDMPPFGVDMDELISQLRTPSIIETTLREILWETTERLATGRVDLEGAVEEVERNIRNYLAERS